MSPKFGDRNTERLSTGVQNQTGSRQRPGGLFQTWPSGDGLAIDPTILEMEIMVSLYQ